MLVASRDAGVARFVYATSSSVYGDHPDQPKCEESIGNPLSPYAVTKRINELYAEQFAQHYRLECRGLRYFNVFGPRQDPNGAYAAVIPRWIAAMIQGEEVLIYGDGETSRDFCHIANVVQANLLAATTQIGDRPIHELFNIAVGEQTTLNELYAILKEKVTTVTEKAATGQLTFADFRTGDVRHSLASIDRATEVFGYKPTHQIRDGLGESIEWYLGCLESDPV